jgi:diaminopimelate epimerase
MGRVVRFTKMQGQGNDYIFVHGAPEPGDPAAAARRLSDRHGGIGADGLVLMAASDRADVKMRMFNADGSEAEMCGTALRCVARFLYERRLVSSLTPVVETGAGNLATRLYVNGARVRTVSADIGHATSAGQLLAPGAGARRRVHTEIDGLAVGFSHVEVGNPHAVHLDVGLEDESFHRIGPRIATDPAFERGLNVEFVEVLAPDELTVRVWERGSGETLACGTGAAAALVAANLAGRSAARATVHLPGGDLDVEWRPDGHLILSGPVTEVFTGEFSADAFW